MESGSIKAINYNSVHKICSGQVVLTLAIAVKELVENSIDAGATIIEVKLKEYGSEMIEIIDNGNGVKASDFQSITLKHHTSKISDFSDVPFVSTFGFRGEALSSLCALSDVEIATCHSESAVGSLLTFDHDGVLVKSSLTHRQVGTTVTIKNLFSTLPVRHKEFHRNIRREYAKMLQLLTAYCLISTNKRITCTNVTDKGRKSVVLSTNCYSHFKDNISCIFSSKQVSSLMEFVQHPPSESVLEEYFLKPDTEKYDMFRIEGYISNSTHREGRSSTDRQFFYINGRPCDLPKVSKLINEVYHSFNKSQYPFVFLNIVLAQGSADVNVTPDKRQIFLSDEKLLLCIIKSSLHQMYQLQPAQMKVSAPNLFFHKCDSEPASVEVESSSASKTFEELSFKRKMDSSSYSTEQGPPFKSLRKVEEEVAPDCPDDSPDSGFQSPGRIKEGNSAAESKCTSPKEVNKGPTPPISNISFTLTLPFNEEKAFKNLPHSKTASFDLKETLLKAYRGKGSFMKSKPVKNTQLKAVSTDKIVNFFSKDSVRKETDFELDNDFESSSTSTGASPLNQNMGNQSSQEGNCVLNYCGSELANVKNPSIDECVLIDEFQPRKRKSRTIAFSIESIKKDLEAKRKMQSDVGVNYRKFRSKIAPADNQSAEKELNKQIKQENFSQMDVIGQFNLGFIITRLNDDLFIIDQHATDEKYNYETLRKQTVLETQKLLNPQSMNLTAVSEALLLDNLHVFEKSGFKFCVDEGNSVGNKVQLISVPVSHNWRFGKEDVDEMIFMLTDNPILMVRPSRVNQMFASRACRKSVMIGTALTLPMMRKLVVHMGQMEQPWNCPHGRPTMRHLFNLKILKLVD